MVALIIAVMIDFLSRVIFNTGLRFLTKIFILLKLDVGLRVINLKL